MDVVVKILAVLNICFIIWIMTCHTRYLLRTQVSAWSEFKSVKNYSSFKRFIHRNSKYLSVHVQRLSLVGIFLVNLSQFNIGNLKHKPDIQFIIVSIFYASFVWNVISSYKKEQAMADKINQLKNKL